MPNALEMALAEAELTEAECGRLLGEGFPRILEGIDSPKLAGLIGEGGELRQGVMKLRAVMKKVVTKAKEAMPDSVTISDTDLEAEK